MDGQRQSAWAGLTLRGLAALTMASPALAQGGEPVAVSAPGVLSLFALALIAIGFGRRRRR